MAANVPMQVFRARAFDGGRNTQFSPHDLGPAESPDDLNVDGETPGSVRKRRGIQKFGENHYGADAITGLYGYYKTNRDRYLMVLCGSVLWAGKGSPPAPSIIKADYSRGTWMSFFTMQDWCYSGNFADIMHRFDGSSVQRTGLPAPALQIALGTLTGGTSTSGGRMPDNTRYIYRFRFRYGKLGLSNLGPNRITVTTGAAATVDDNTVTFNGLESFRPGAAGSMIPAGATPPTHLQIWRTLGLPVAALTGEDSYAFPYYLVGEIPFPTAGAVSYTDDKADIELLVLYEGNDRSEPYLDLWAGSGDATLHNAPVNGSYLWTPRARYVAEHRNRAFYANCQFFYFDIDGVQQPVELQPSRVYWSDLYEPDRITGFVNVNPEDGDEITGIYSFHNNLLVFKRTKTYLILGNAPENFEARLVNGYVGMVAPRSGAYLDDMFFFLAHDGVYVFDGANIRRISDRIRPDILAIANTDREMAAGGSWRGRYYLAYREP